MKELFANGRIVDFIFVLVVLEAVTILAWRFAKKSGPAPLPFMINLLAGASLMLALRNALAGVSWVWIAGCLIVALTAHVIDLVWRWERAERLPAKLRDSKASLSGR